VIALACAAGVAWAQTSDPLDPAHNLALPCSAVGTPGSVPRAARNIVHVANVCGFVGTDVEFQSRMADDGLHDYAFLGTMGEGLKIFDVTDPAHPRSAGQYTDSGWQNDVQVRGDLAVIGFDPLTSGINPSISACLHGKGASGGVDLVRLEYDKATATFTTHLRGCVSASPSGGAHNATIHPSGNWLAMVNPRGQGSVDVVDLRSTQPFRKYRVVQEETMGNAACMGAATGQCISNGRPSAWSPHDLHFSKDGRTMYVAAVGDDTVLVDVRNVLSGSVKTIGVAPNDSPPSGVGSNPHDVEISHQSDVSSDGAILVVTDERGGGTSENRCNTQPNGMIGGMHFWALERLSGVTASVGASPASPKRIGGWFYPDPTVLPDPLATQLAMRGRAERACTIHVFRLGGNGTASPGSIQKGYDGVSTLPRRQVVSAHYGAGVWHIDFSRARSDTDGVVEAPFTTWGNTLGWNVMPGAETWSAKEYKGFIYAGDMVRGFDVYGFAECEGLACAQILPAACGLADLDFDGDGLVAGLENFFDWLVDDPDSDRDGVRDGNEDSDGDGRHDEDADDGTDTCAADSDGDGTDDEDEDDD
jgi:hypothetical protein